MRDLTDAEAEVCVDRLKKRLAPHMAQEMNDRLIGIVDDIIKDHRNKLRLQGLDFPKLVAIALPSIRQFELVRADLDVKSIKTIIVNITVKFPHVHVNDIAFGIGRVFPDFREGFPDVRRTLQ